jgi:hypothetical protein
MDHLYRTVAAVATAALVTLMSPAAMAQSPAPLRVLGASPDAKAVAKIGDGATIKARVARPDVAALDAIARYHAATRDKTRFVIDLFPGLELEAEVISAEARPDGTTLFARLTEIELGSAVFTIEGGVLTATVDFPGGSYLVTPQTDGYHQVAQKAAQLFPLERDPRTAFPVSRAANPFAPADTIQLAPADSGRLIDIMVVWTPAAETAAGGLVAMQNLAQAAVDSANAAYLNSGVAQRLRLVHRQQVTYTERTNCSGGNAFDCALDDVTDNGDGYIDNVHTLRDTHGADLVALLINDGVYCGIAWLPSTPSEDQGFSVTAQNCAVGNKSFAHELGHNMGAHHDPANATPWGPKPFNKGYVDPLGNWRTVMAYSAPCGGCTRLAYFSNPKLTYAGTAMGTAGESNNAHVLNFTGKAIAGYRATSALHPVAQRFADVPTDHTFYGHIEFFAQAEISNGCAVGQFCPDGPTSRRAMAAFLERTMRASNWIPPTTTTAFTDVVAGSQFAGEIEAMRTDGVTLGCTATTYCPESSVTRAQMAVFVLRARCGGSYVPNTPGTLTFSDVPLSHPFVAYIEKLYSLGITGGCAAGPLRYCPDASVTRGQMAAFIERAYPFITPSESCSL